MKMNTFYEYVMQNKRWIQRINEMEENKIKNNNENEEIDENEDEYEDTPFDILERVKDILDQDIDDPSDDDEIKKIRNAEIASKKEVILKPASKFLGEILKIAKENDYIEDYKVNDSKELFL